jgi:hypothetical protein
MKVKSHMSRSRLRPIASLAVLLAFAFIASGCLPPPRTPDPWAGQPPEVVFRASKQARGIETSGSVRTFEDTVWDGLNFEQKATLAAVWAYDSMNLSMNEAIAAAKKKNPANVALFSGVSVPSFSFTMPRIDFSPLYALNAQITAGILASQAKNSMQAQPVLPGTETTLGSAPGNIANDATKGHSHPTTSGASIAVSGPTPTTPTSPF